MTVLFAINILLACVLMLWPLWFSRILLRLPTLNPFSIVLLIQLPIEGFKLFGGPALLIDKGLLDVGFQFAVLASNLQLLMQFTGACFFLYWSSRLGIGRCLSKQQCVLLPIDLQRSAAFFLCIYVACFLLLASAEYGVLNWVMNPRTGYQLYRTGQGHWYALAISSMSVAFLLGFLAKPTTASVLFSTPFYLAFAYLLGSKMVMLSVFTSALVFLWLIGWRHLAKLLFWGAPAVFMLLVWNLALALSDGFELLSIIEYFDFYKNAADYYTEYLAGNISLYWGEIGATSIAAYVPRVIWPDKPVVYGVLLINELFYPGQAELTNTPAFGGAVEQFADFGFVGVALSGFFSSTAVISGVGAALLFKHPGLELRRVTLTATLILLVMFVPSFGLFFPGLLYVTLLLLVAILLRLLRLRVHRSLRANLRQPERL